MPKLVKQANYYAKAKGFPASFLVCTVLDLPLESNSVDEYVSLGVIEHFRSELEVIQILKECRRVLKPGGTAIITIPNIFVLLVQRLLLWLSKGRIGLFHKLLHC
jgi:ubiquinone/menaquinone biosynthesis C-methylase UbiE